MSGAVTLTGFWSLATARMVKAGGQLPRNSV
jgi:hypothetical protein